MTVETIQKRDGRMVAFDESKIALRLQKLLAVQTGLLQQSLQALLPTFYKKDFKKIFPALRMSRI
ncbi:MAG: hypothetical protein ACYSR1_10320 [Planctomycetota bacterium]